MRGPGEAPGLFALEVAHGRTGLRHRYRPVGAASGQRPGHSTNPAAGHGRGKHLRDCYLQGAERFGWAATAAPRHAPCAATDVQVGWGMATASYPGRRMPSGCQVITTADGHVRSAAATHEIGTGVRTVMAQIGADADRDAAGDGDLRIRGLTVPRRALQRCIADHRPPWASAVELAGRQWRQRLGGEPVSSAGRTARPAAARSPELVRAAGRSPSPSGGPADNRPGVTVFRRTLLRGRSGRGDRAGRGHPVDRGDGLRARPEPEAGDQPGDGRYHLRGGYGAVGTGALRPRRLANSSASTTCPRTPTAPTSTSPSSTFRTTASIPSGYAVSVRSAPAGCPPRSPTPCIHATGKRLHDLPITLESLLQPFESRPAS